MWIEPPDIQLSNATIGMRFNITIWLNVSTPTMSWQFYLIYNRTHLEALRCGFTGDNRSLWSGNLTADAPGQPDFDYHNGTFKSILFAETLRDGVQNTGMGSLAWVEFNITKTPLNATLGPIMGQMRLDIPNPQNNFMSFAINASFSLIPLDFGNSVYRIIPEFPFSTMLLFLLAVSVITITLNSRTRETLSSLRQA
jgi:hypothetical protein